MIRKKILKFLISAGPTREPLDSIRFISNYSTGYLGYEVAKAAKRRGHKVVLVSGPAAFRKPAGIKCVDVITAKEMLKALKDNIKWADCLIMTAAVSDFRPKKAQLKKIKKGTHKLNLQLVENPDILKCLKPYKKGRIYIGFALETHNPRENARKKLKSKGLDIIVANKKESKSTCFGKTNNTYYIIDNSFKYNTLKDRSKSYLSRRLIDKSLNLWYNLNNKEKVDKIG